MKHKALLLMLAGTLTVHLGCGAGGDGSVPICTAFSACGGDPTGKWTIDGVCTENDIAGQLLADLPPECNGAVQSVSLDVSGTLEYASGSETSDVLIATGARLVYTSACISAKIGAPTTVTQAVCDLVASIVAPADGPTVSCKLTGDACDCAMNTIENIQETDTYTLSGSMITYSDGSAVQFCVSGSTLTVREISTAMQFKLHRS